MEVLPQPNLLELERVAASDNMRRLVAPYNPSIFVGLVLQDEETGKPVSMSEIHKSWQRLLTDYDRLVIWSSVESGKTQQVSIGRVLWELGVDPTMRIGIISNTHEQAAKIVRTIARYIEQSEELHEVFPELIPGDIWTSSQLTIKRPVRSKDPSVQACGVHGNIVGARIDRLLLDDILDYENCRTDVMRKDLREWYHATLAGRLTARSKVWCVGTAYHPDDLMHHFALNPRWYSVRYPILDPDTGLSRWPERWPQDRIERRRQELGPLEFARQMLCMARDDSESRFQRAWIDGCLVRGRGRTLVPSLDIIPRGFRAITGVDLGVQKHSAADKTVLFTLGVHPDGSREVLWVESGRWSGPEILDRIVDTHRRYHSIVWVENNAAQDFILQFARQTTSIPVHGFTTGRSKASPEFGVESIAAEMAGNKWIIPCNLDGSTHPEISAWIQEMLYYDPAGHTGDRLMASWFAREGARKGGSKAQYTRLDLMTR